MLAFRLAGCVVRISISTARCSPQAAGEETRKREKKEEVAPYFFSSFEIPKSETLDARPPERGRSRALGTRTSRRFRESRWILPLN
jgi:hypothetical protein